MKQSVAEGLLYVERGSLPVGPVKVAGFREGEWESAELSKTAVSVTAKKRKNLIRPKIPPTVSCRSTGRKIIPKG